MPILNAAFFDPRVYALDNLSFESAPGPAVRRRARIRAWAKCKRPTRGSLTRILRHVSQDPGEFNARVMLDPSGLFNSSLDGNVRRAIDIHEGDKIDEAALKDLIRAAVALNLKGKNKLKRRRSPL